ncbi:MAG: hypothetical protein JO084_19785 [Bradyrhizobiaceae bacterium]|nr:hypothetical protein [Bradyrhizobiaceae bacterium]
MQFQPGQSGNPAGRPPGSRNKKTLAMEEIFAATAEDTAKFIVARAQCGHGTAMRICVERTPPALELPPVRCAADAQKALNMVIEAFGRGAITVREFPSMIAAVERMTRTAERIQALSEREHDGAADETDGDGLYSPVNSDVAEAVPAQPTADGMKNAAGKKAADQASAAATEPRNEREGLYFPVNSNASAPKPTPSSTSLVGAAMADVPPAPALETVIREHADALRAHASGSTASRRRRALMESVSPAALRLGALPVDPRSYVTDQTWLAAMLETGLHGAIKRKAA